MTPKLFFVSDFSGCISLVPNFGARCPQTQALFGCSEKIHSVKLMGPKSESTVHTLHWQIEKAENKPRYFEEAAKCNCQLVGE